MNINCGKKKSGRDMAVLEFSFFLFFIPTEPVIGWLSCAHFVRQNNLLSRFFGLLVRPARPGNNNNTFSSLLSPQKYFIELHRNVMAGAPNDNRVILLRYSEFFLLTYLRFSEVVFFALAFLDQDVATVVDRGLLKILV